MNITSHQIRAGRALKNWNQHKLAAKAGVAVPTIANIEIEKQKPSKRTLDKIQTALEKAGIEFINHDGVQKKQSSVQILRGQEEYISFYYFVYEYAREHGGPIYTSNAEEDYYEKWFPGFYNSEYYHNMVRIRDQMDFRILVQEGRTDFKARAYVTYRWLPETQASPIPFEVFGEYLAIKLLFLDEPIIFLIKDQKTADLYREKFILQWDNAIIPPQFMSD